MAEKPAAKVAASRVEATQAEAPEKKKEVPPEKVASSKVVKKTVPIAAPEKRTLPEEPETEAADNVDDLLAAVEAMRAKRPGLRARKLPPSVEEMDRRRLQLRETIGRILASL